MLSTAFETYLASEIRSLREAGLYKERTRADAPRKKRKFPGQGRTEPVLNFCANNYLGLSDHPRMVEAAQAALDRYGFGMSSVRFICGTQDDHKALEMRLSRFLGTEDTILYGSCFDANTGLFETILGEEDAIISDALNHASIIDGIRLCKAQRLRYAQQRHGRARGPLKEAADCALPADRHRRRFLDGRDHRQSRRRSAISPSATMRW